MPDSSSPSETPQRSLAWLVCDFITVVLSLFLLLAILHTVQYHFRLFLVEAAPPPCTKGSSCARVSLHLAQVSPLDVRKTTTICAALVFIGMCHGGRRTHTPAPGVVARALHETEYVHR